MTLSVANAKNMRFTARYPVDKVVNIYTGTFTANASSSTLSGERTHEVITHTYGANCLLELVYSLDGGTTWNDMDMQIPNLAIPTAPVFQTTVVSPFSTTTTFVIAACNFTTSSKTVQYIMTASWLD